MCLFWQSKWQSHSVYRRSQKDVEDNNREEEDGNDRQSDSNFAKESEPPFILNDRKDCLECSALSTLSVCVRVCARDICLFEWVHHNASELPCHQSWSLLLLPVVL